MTTKVLEAHVIGGDAVAKLFRDKESLMRVKLRATMSDIGSEVQTRAIADAPVGKRGKLKRSSKLKVFDRAFTIAARIAFKQFYGRFVELGYGPTKERVRGYVRRDNRGTLFNIKKRGGFGKRKLAQGVIFVNPFSRVGKARPHPFLVPAVGRGDEIRARLSAVVENVMRMEG